MGILRGEHEALPDFSFEDVEQFSLKLIKVRRDEARKTGKLLKKLPDVLKNLPVTWVQDDFFGIKVAFGKVSTSSGPSSLRPQFYWCDGCEGWIKGFPLEQEFDNHQLGMEHAAGSNYYCVIDHRQIGQAITTIS